MAIKDLSKKQFVEDRNENIFIGIDLPFRKGENSEGWFASTTTTIDAVKNNIRNLLRTHKGERLMHPNMGLNLRNLLFEPNMQELDMRIQSEITEVEQSQTRLDNIQKSSVVDVYSDDIVSQIKEVEAKGTTKQSISAKLFAIEEAKKNSK